MEHLVKVIFSFYKISSNMTKLAGILFKMRHENFSVFIDDHRCNMCKFIIVVICVNLTSVLYMICDQMYIYI